MKNMKLLLVLAVVWLFVDASGFAADNEPSNSKSSAAQVSSKKLKLDGNEVDLTRLEKEGGYKLGQVTRKQKMRNGKEADIKLDRRAMYFAKSKRIAYVESAIYNDAAQGELKVYDADGNKVFEKKLEPEKGVYRDFQEVKAIGEHRVMAFISNAFVDSTRRMEIYDTANNQVVFSTTMSHASGVFVPPSEDYLLLLLKVPGNAYSEIYKYDFKELKKIASGDNLYWNSFSNDGMSYVLTKSHKINEKTTYGGDFKESEIQFYAGDKLNWKKTVKYEAMQTSFSALGRFFILQLKKDVKFNGKYVVSWTTVYSVLEASNGKIVIDGELSPEEVDKYKSEKAGGGTK